MKNTYYLSFKIPIAFELDFLGSFVRQLDELGIKNKHKIEEKGLIEIVYQNEAFLISLESYVHFSSVFKIRTDKSCTTENRGGFITLMWRLLNWKYSVAYGDMEFFSDETFKLVNNRFDLRFVNYKTLHEVIDQIEIAKAVRFEKYTDGQTSIIETTVSIENNTAEQVWISIAKGLDYDGWDIVNREYAPLTMEEYVNETKEFSQYWDIDHKKYLLQNDSVVSILRLGKSWNSNEYLIDEGRTLHYISTDVWTG